MLVFAYGSTPPLDCLRLQTHRVAGCRCGGDKNRDSGLSVARAVASFPQMRFDTSCRQIWPRMLSMSPTQDMAAMIDLRPQRASVLTDSLKGSEETN